MGAEDVCFDHNGSKYSHMYIMQKKGETDIPETRRRRESGRCNIGSRNTCILYLRSYPTLFNKFIEELDNVCIAQGILKAILTETDA